MFRYIIGLSSKILLILLINIFNQHWAYARQSGALDERRLTLQLKKDTFYESYQLLLTENGSDTVDDADARHLGDGIVSLAGLATDGTLLSIDERLSDTTTKLIHLYSKGQMRGQYELSFRASREFFAAYRIKLLDRYLNVSKEIKAADTVYTFFADTGMTSGQAGIRFDLLLESLKGRTSPTLKTTGDILIYPNPFHGTIYVDAHRYVRPLSVVVRDFMGRKILTAHLNEQNGPYEFPTAHFAAGPYLLELFDQKTGLRIKSLKLIKQ